MKGIAVVALTAGVAFPCLAIVQGGLTDLLSRPRTSGWVLPALGVFIRSSAWSLCGGVFIAALLADWRFMTQTEQFLGVKVSQFFPFLFAVVALVGRVDPMPDEAPAARGQRVRGHWTSLWQEPVRLGIAMAGVIMLGGLVFWLARTGNQPGVGVSPLELKFRSILESFLIVRPRTKEFAFGHPALILAALWAVRGRTEWARWAGAFAAIGQTSLLNTFCHLHTPIWVALVRSFHGLWIGAAIGLVAAWVAGRVIRDP